MRKQHKIDGQGQLIVEEVLNSKNEPIVLNQRETQAALALEKKFYDEMYNALGFEIPMTTLYALSKSVIEQKFFTVRPSDYMPVRVGDNAWSTEILTLLDFSLGGDFENGNINTGASNSRLAEADGGLDSVKNKVQTWAKGITWTLADLKYAARMGQWDVITSKERARKKNWDLGIQSIAFFGSKYDANIKGFLTQSGVTANTVIITGYLKSLSTAAFEAFLENLIESYRLGNGRTAYPDLFTIPEADFNGLGVAVDETFPLKSRLARIEEAFRLVTQNPNFKVKPCAYCDQVNNANVSGLNKNRYVLSRMDEDSLRMDIPVDYTNTIQNTLNGFQYENAGYGQYTGPLAYRPLEMEYFDWAA